MKNTLDFELPILEIEKQIKNLSTKIHKNKKLNIKLQKKIDFLKRRSVELTKKIFSNLDAWQITQLSRHPMRPHTLDYIRYIFDDFDELSGDRTYSDDKAIVGGIARLNNKSIMVIGHQKGRTIKEKIYRNFGMPAPEGYRKALRLMKMADYFKIPLVTFIDTPGAYPGIGAEERGQSEAIAKNLQTMSFLKIPIICNVIGEGGSGGALAIGIGDRINMLEYSTYSVISPEGCASILWKNVNKASIAAEAIGLVSTKLKKLGFIDNIIKEPLGGAHKNFLVSSYKIKKQILEDLSQLETLDRDTLINCRYNRLMNYGYC